MVGHLLRGVGARKANETIIGKERLTAKHHLWKHHINVAVSEVGLQIDREEASEQREAKVNQIPRLLLALGSLSLAISPTVRQ